MTTVEKLKWPASEVYSSIVGEIIPEVETKKHTKIFNDQSFCSNISASIDNLEDTH